MNTRTFVFFTFICVTALSTACGVTETQVNHANANTANTNAQMANDPVAVTTPKPEEITNNAPTLTPVIKAYCAARVRNDEAALRKIYSAETLRGFEAQMKDDGVKSLVEFLSGEAVSNEPCNAANERMDGDRAIAKITLEWAPNGIDLVFVKESGEWKLTTEAPTLKLQRK